MGGKNAENAQASKKGVDEMPDEPTPQVESQEATRCVKNHWIGVKGVDEAGKGVHDVTVKLKASDGTESTVVLAKKKLRSGEYKTGKVLAAGNCEISFPAEYDVEWKPQ